MRYPIVFLLLSLTACEPPPPAKIAAPQREMLDKAKGVQQTVDAQQQQLRQQVDAAEGK
ncbi:hypothetical protein [Pseudogulbenkiania subflava]|uniref:Lipoprotein n=1 Tax=Pseudogulbenkiania subflava DSM 22618 TaxID=1123014 RepID=A0A1Y6BU93_9NEIS|nr:hypothetical protein [Pseudogulbenkiania subflava]SMF28283.1 hypothetical protein SAMN02745746_02337 [Pseudogulbenkiania subflava DSM 22618]